MIFRLLRSDPLKEPVAYLHAAIVGGARNPVLYAGYGVPDTVEGRFEAITLHLALVHQHLRTLGAQAEHVAQLLTDRYFADLDAGIREIGISDVGVPRKMKMLAQAYFGRSAAYETMFAAGGEPAVALARNVVGDETRADTPALAAFAAYVSDVRHHLAELSLDGVLALTGEEFARLARWPAAEERTGSTLP